MSLAPATAGCVGIVIALQTEVRVLTDQPIRPGCIVALANGSAVLLSGMGQDAAHKAALALADAGAQALATFGVCGGLKAGLRSGTLICPQVIFDQSGRSFSVDRVWRDQLQQRLEAAGLSTLADGAVVSLAKPLLTPSSKNAAHRRYNAVAVDMESASVAAVAAQRGLPFLALRAIVDESSDELPEALQAVIDPWGRPRWAQLLALLLAKPWLVASLPKLSSQMKKALTALRTAGLIVPGLTPSPCLTHAEAG